MCFSDVIARPGKGSRRTRWHILIEVDGLSSCNRAKYHSTCRRCAQGRSRLRTGALWSNGQVHSQYVIELALRFSLGADGKGHPYESVFPEEEVTRGGYKKLQKDEQVHNRADALEGRLCCCFLVLLTGRDVGGFCELPQIQIIERRVSMQHYHHFCGICCC